MADITDQQMVDFFKSKGYAKPDYGVLGALGGAYGAYANGNAMNDAYSAQASAAQQQAQILQQQQAQMPTLASLYGQDSPYAQQLRTTLQAGGAAKGQNSQVGPREVQLQAALADKASQYGSAQAGMAAQYSQAQQQAQQARAQAILGQQQVQAQQLGSLFNLADKSGYLQKANTGLQGLYDQYFPGSQQSTPMSDSPYSGGGGYSGYTTGSDQNFAGYDSNAGMGQMYGPAETSAYTPEMDYSQSPTSSYNMNFMDYLE